jgi:hypothetical protein
MSSWGHRRGADEELLQQAEDQGSITKNTAVGGDRREKARGRTWTVAWQDVDKSRFR